MGVATGCVCKEVHMYIDFLILLSLLCSFLQQHPYFLFIFKMFFVLVIYIPWVGF